MGSKEEGSGLKRRITYITGDSLRALITDMDGTLVDLGIDWDALRERIRREMGWRHPLRPLGMSIAEVARSDEEARRAYSIVEEEEYRAAQRAKRDDDLIRFLSNLKNRGVKLGLVTMQAMRSTKVVLSRLGVLDLFDIIVTRDRSIRRDEQLRMAMNALGVNPHEVLFIGDTPWDVESAKRIGVAFISVRNCYKEFPCVKDFKEIAGLII